MRLWDKTLAALIVRYTQRVYSAIRQWVGLGDLEQAQQSLEQGYRTAHVSGVRWSLLDLLGFRERVEATPEALERLALARGLEVEITQPQVLERLGNQISVAKSRMLEHLSVPGTEARAAGYAVRWGVQQGIADVAEHSSVALPDGSAGEILKQWIRLAARAERRAWHDALNGVTIPYSQKFRLSSPRGIYLIDRPYDPALPVGEKIGCGHGTRLLLPEDAEIDGLFGVAPSKSGGSGGEPARGRPSRFRPVGLSITETIQVPNHPLAAVVDRALGVAARVHGAGLLPPIPVRFKARIPEGLAAYTYIQDTGAPYGIELLARPLWKELEVLEEIGHFIDHQAFTSGRFESLVRRGKLEGTLSALYETPTIQRFQKAQELGYYFGDQGKPIVADATELKYLLNPKEMFARAYAQYTAISSGDLELLKQVGGRRSGRYSWYNRAWEDDEFEPVAAAIEQVLRDLGMTR